MTLPLTILSVMVLAGSTPQSTVSPNAGAASPQTQVPTSFVRVYPSDTPQLVAPVAVHTAHPRYTPEALQAKVQGRIEMQVTVGADGRVRDAMITHGLDSIYGMDDRAVATVSEWVFEPGRLGGQPVPVRTTVSFTLQLR